MSSRRLILLLACAASVAACSAPLRGGAPTPAREAQAVRSAPPELARLNQLLVDLVARLRPGLVSVRPGRGAASEEWTGRSHQPRAGGAGFVIAPNGTIVTAAHVVPDGGLVHVELSDGRRVTGRVVGKDARADLALVKVEGAAGLATLPFGDSDRLSVGELVVALGHPFGLERAVSLGIVSRKGPPPTGGIPGFDFIQTDASVNRGNSGGPLVNMAGEVVGVNSWAARNGSMGIAIPANLVKILLPQLAAKGRVEWGWLGVAVAEVRQEDLERLGLPEPRGVLIRRVMPGAPADKSGFRADDVIVAVDGQRVHGPRDLQRLIASTPVGTRIRITLVRTGREVEVAVIIEPYDVSSPPGGSGSEVFSPLGRGADLSATPPDHRALGASGDRLARASAAACGCPARTPRPWAVGEGVGWYWRYDRLSFAPLSASYVFCPLHWSPIHHEAPASDEGGMVIGQFSPASTAVLRCAPTVFFGRKYQDLRDWFSCAENLRF